MTDEERAREIAAKCVGIIYDKNRIADHIREAFAAIREHEREECAKEMDAVSAHNYAFGSSHTALAMERIAAAIRARGGKT